MQEGRDIKDKSCGINKGVCIFENFEYIFFFFFLFSNLASNVFFEYDRNARNIIDVDISWKRKFLFPERTHYFRNI